MTDRHSFPYRKVCLPQADATSGSLDSSSNQEYRCWVHRNIAGSDIPGANPVGNSVSAAGSIMTASACMTICNQNTQCTFFVLSGNGLCYLKNSFLTGRDGDNQYSTLSTQMACLKASLNPPQGSPPGVVYASLSSVDGVLSRGAWMIWLVSYLSILD